MKTAAEILSATPDRQIVHIRELNVSPEKVFQAFSDPMHLANWWGPKGFTNTFSEFDFRPDGRWIYVMHGPEKGNYNNECIFAAIEEPRLVVWNRISNPIFQMVILLEPLENEQTRITFKMVFDTAEERQKLIKYVPEKNEENLDKLECELQAMYS